MDTEHILFLVVGVVVVFVVGQLLVRTGGRYLANAAPGEGGSAGSAATLVSILFHLLGLGIVILITVLPIGSNSQQSFLLQLGILLVLLAILYGVTLMLLGRRRQEALITEMEMPHTPPGGNVPPQSIRSQPGTAQAAPSAGQIDPVPGIIDNTPPDAGARY